MSEFYNADKKESSIKRIQEKLNILIEKEDSDFLDFTNATDHDYELPYVVDCLMYYITGEICQKLENRNCVDCKSACERRKCKSNSIKSPYSKIDHFRPKSQSSASQF